MTGQMLDNTINNDMTMGGAAGTLLAGRYHVVRQLGQGGMRAMWLARDMAFDKSLAFVDEMTFATEERK